MQVCLFTEADRFEVLIVFLEQQKCCWSDIFPVVVQQADAVVKYNSDGVDACPVGVALSFLKSILSEK